MPPAATIEIHSLPSWDSFVEAVRTGPQKNGANEISLPRCGVLSRPDASVDWRLWAPLDRRLAIWNDAQEGAKKYINTRKTRGMEWYVQNLCTNFGSFQR